MMSSGWAERRAVPVAESARVTGDIGTAEEVGWRKREREREKRKRETRHPTNDAEWVHHYVLFWPARGSNNRGGATPMLRARQLLLV